MSNKILVNRREALALAAAVAAAPGMSSASVPARVHRTPEARFAAVEGFPYSPRFAEVHYPTSEGGAARIRIAYYVAGPAQGPQVLLMHGNPEWAFIYRKFASELAAAGFRVIMPDLPGFGRSDKPLDAGWYSYERLVDVMSEWFLQSVQGEAMLLCQDWGGLIGLRLVDRWPDRFQRVLTANTALPFGAEAPGPELLQWVNVISPAIARASDVLRLGSQTRLDAATLAAYDAPFDTPDSLVALRTLPKLIPLTHSYASALENEAAFGRLRHFARPWLCVYGDGDPLTRGAYDLFRTTIAGAHNQPHALLKSGHFIQEDQASELSLRALSFFKS